MVTGIVVVAAGIGSRFGSSLPKQFIRLAGKPVLRHCLDTFAHTFDKATTVVVLSEEGRHIWETYCHNNGYSSPTIVLGGSSRSASVLNGLIALRTKGLPDDAVIYIHDGARPLLSPDLLRRLRSAVELGNCAAAAPALPLTDSIAAVADGKAVRGIDRQSLQALQTPQVFRLGDIIKALTGYDTSAHGEATDECGAYLSTFGKPVSLVHGDIRNIKITNPIDIKIAELYLSIASESPTVPT